MGPTSATGDDWSARVGGALFMVVSRVKCGLPGDAGIADVFESDQDSSMGTPSTAPKSV